MSWSLNKTLLVGIILRAGLGISFNNILLSWSIIEVNLIFFIPILMFRKNFFFSNMTGLKYFFIQSLASIILLSIIMMTTIFSEETFLNFFILLRLRWKIGIPPFHSWLINLIIDLDYNNFFILSTWQKVIPFYIIRRLLNKYIEIMILVSLLFSLLLRINQTRVKKMLVISSIFTASWVIAAILFSKIFWIWVLLLYGIILWVAVKCLFPIKSQNKISFVIMSNSLKEKIILFMVTLSIAGFPPLIGFYLKLLVIVGLIFLKIIFISTGLIFSSVILIYIYRTIFFTRLIRYSLELSYQSYPSYFNSFLIYPIIRITFLPLLIFFA